MIAPTKQHPHRSRPRVALGMPVYNGASVLKPTLDSLLSQTYGDFELIISDNGSTDQTETICRDYAARDQRISYVRQPINRGSVWNFNEVFRLARSEYFRWCACDDLCGPTLLARCVELLDTRPDVVWCHCRSMHIDRYGRPLHGALTREISYIGDGDGRPGTATRAAERASDRFRAVLLGRDGCIDSFALMRSRVVRQTALLLPYFGAEKVFIAELALRGRYAEVPQTLFFVRIHPQAAGAVTTARQQRQLVNPLSAKRLQFVRLKLLGGYVAAVRRSPLAPAERMQCYGAIAQYVLQVRKWRRVLAAALAGAGLRGEYPSSTPAVDSDNCSGAASDLNHRVETAPTTAPQTPSMARDPI